MAVPIHTLNILQRPKEGSHFQRRVVALNYQHSIAAQGWYDTASCDIAVRSQTEGQDYLNNYLGCFVQAFADNPVEPMWEGLINRITFNSGGASYSIGLDEMANRINVRYSNDSATVNGVGVNTPVTTANSTTSQAIYGIKEDVLEFGYNRNGNAGHANALRDTVLAQRAFPQTSITQGQGQTNLVHLELIGIFHTLEWEKMALSTATTTVFDLRITGDILGAIGNGTTFFDNTDFGAISANAINTTGTQKNGITYWEYLLKIAEGGDGVHYWVAGILPTDFNTGKRIAYYRAMNAAVEYTARQADGLRVRDVYGRIVPPWLVKPDRTIRVTDVLIGFNSAVTTDPRETYIFSVQYDANRQMATWMGADDTTARGAYMLKRGFKPYGRAFGAGLRVPS